MLGKTPCREDISIGMLKFEHVFAVTKPASSRAPRDAKAAIVSVYLGLDALSGYKIEQPAVINDVVGGSINAAASVLLL